MALYEHVVIARPDISNQQAEAILEEMKAILAENGGTVAKTEYWGLKNLSYRIRKHRKGHYGLLNIEAESPAIVELERRLKIHDDVIRFLTIRVEEHETGQSAPLQRRGDDRDERGGGGRFGDRDRGGRGGGGGFRGDRDRGDRGGGDRGPRGGFGDRDRPPRRDTPDAGPTEGGV